MVPGPSWRRSNVTRKATRTSRMLGHLDMKADTLSSGLTSVYGSMGIASSALGVDMGVYNKRTRAFENSNAQKA